MAAGRRKKPDVLKIVQGTSRPDRSSKTKDLQEPAPISPPGWLEESALPHFAVLVGRISALKLDSATYTENLAMAATRMAEIEACNAEIKARGRVIESDVRGGGKSTRANPAVAMRNEAMRHLQSLLAEFGLSPSSIGRAAGSAPGERKKTEQKSFGAL